MAWTVVHTPQMRLHEHPGLAGVAVDEDLFDAAELGPGAVCVGDDAGSVNLRFDGSVLQFE